MESISSLSLPSWESPFQDEAFLMFDGHHAEQLFADMAAGFTFLTATIDDDRLGGCL
jgi:hypothetical protein